MMETLGVLAHRGGLVVERPELTVGIVRAVSRPTGLEFEVLARRPLDRRSASERQADIRAGRATSSVAPQRLLPQFDEGLDLRVGWLDDDGRAHWEFGAWWSSSGDDFEGRDGPSLRTRLDLPPLFDHVSVVFAWPEIGFPETVVELPLPDRATVERDTISVWEAPLRVNRPPASLRRRAGADPLDEPAVEAGRIVAPPRVLSRGDDAVVVLTRLTAVGETLAIEIFSMATGEAWLSDPQDPEQMRTQGTGASIAVLGAHDAVRVPPYAWSAGGGAGTFRSTAEFALGMPDGDVLALLVAWPDAGLPDVCVEIPLSGQ